MPVRVLIVDDAPLFREIAREVLDARGYTVVGEADTAAAAADAAERLQPDAVLLDLRLPDGNGLEVSATLTRITPAPAVLLVSADRTVPDPDMIEAAGARGFLPKSRLACADLTQFWPSP